MKANGLFWRKYSLSGELSLLAEDVVSFGGKCQDFENVRSHSNGSPLQRTNILLGLNLQNTAQNYKLKSAQMRRERNRARQARAGTLEHWSIPFSLLIVMMEVAIKCDHGHYDNLEIVPLMMIYHG